MHYKNMLVETPTHQTLVCDDVFTTGTSFKEFVEEKYPMVKSNGLQMGCFCT